MQSFRSSLLPAAFLACLTAPAGAGTGLSLLEELLSDAPALAISLTNLAQNLARIDASVMISTERHFTAMADILAAYAADRQIYGSTVALGAGMIAAELTGALPGGSPLTLDIGAISTTGLGTLQSSDMTGTYNGAGLVQRIAASTDAGGVAVTAESHGSLGGVLAMQNIALNLGGVGAAAHLNLFDTEARIGQIATTAIGSLQSGALNTSIELVATAQGHMGDLAETSAMLALALVGR